MSCHIHYIKTIYTFADMNEIEELLKSNGRGRPSNYGFTDLEIHEANVFTARGEDAKDGRPTKAFANKVNCAAILFYAKRGQKVARRIKGADVYIIRVA